MRVDLDVFETLANKRQGFETPNECLKRILTEKGICTLRTKEQTAEADTSNGEQ